MGSFDALTNALAAVLGLECVETESLRERGAMALLKGNVCADGEVNLQGM